MRLYCCFVRCYLLFLLVILNVNADDKVSLEDFDFLLKIGALDRFIFVPKHQGGFDWRNSKERDESKESGLYVIDTYSYRISSSKDKIILDKKIDSNAIELHLSRSPKNVEKKGSISITCYPSVKLDEEGLINQLSRVFTWSKSARSKDEHGCSRADFARELLIENLKSVSADIYVEDKVVMCLNRIKKNQINTMMDIMKIREMFKQYSSFNGSVTNK